MIPIYVVSLPTESERKKHISRQLEQYDLHCNWIDAVDLRAIDDAELDKLRCKHGNSKQKKPLSRGEIGCAMSHHQIYQTIVEENHRYSLILEDDAQFIRNPLPLLDTQNLDDIQKQYPFDILIIGYVKTLSRQLPFYYRRIPIKHRAAVTLNNEIIRFGTPWEQYGCGTVAYIITKQGAEKLLPLTEKPQVAADNWLFFEKNAGLKILHARPTFVLEELEKFNSTIRTETPDFLSWSYSSIIIRSLKGWIKNFLMNTLNVK